MALENTVVRVKQGQLRGVVEENVYGDMYLAFCGIPYAKPPLGQLRFKDPEPAEPWTGIRDASKYGDSCAQISIFTREYLGSDDCLYLNVYRPFNDSDTKRSVMVWIHGGGFFHGSADNVLYGPDYLIRKDIVLVTINYRVGVLGFMNLENELAPGNQGLKDQVLALKWVQENISSFGGDPNNVTIFGESAGGSSVHYLAISPLGQGLFHKAISQSGVSTNPWAYLTKNPKNYAYELAAKLGEYSTDPQAVLDFLRTADAKTLITTEATLIPPPNRHVMWSIFGPGIDDKSKNPFLPKPASELMKEGVKVPFIIGFNSNEGSLLLSPFSEPYAESKLRVINSDFKTVVPISTQDYLKKEGISVNDVKHLYFGNELISKKTMQQYADYISDVLFLRDIHDVINIQIEKSTQPTYFYKFNFDTEDSIMKRLLNVPLKGATHADDILYLFCASLTAKTSLGPPKEGSDKYKVMEYFTQMWTDFAKTGNPTPNITETITTQWKPLKNSDEYNYLSINRTLQMETCKKEGQRFDWKKLKNKL